MRAARRAAVAAFAAVGVAAAVAADGDGQRPRPLECKVTIVGGGIGGAYTAWRLAVDARAVRPADICLFEASTRFGGRIFTVQDVPGYPGFVTDIGAYRFHRTEHPLIRSLVEDRLQMETACYTDPTAALPMNVAECPEDNKIWTTTRTKSFVGNLETLGGWKLPAWTPAVPFQFTDAEKWGTTAARKERRRLPSVFAGPNSMLPELATRWAALTDPNTTYEKAMALADQAIAALAVGRYKGVPYAEVSVIQIARDAGMSVEELAMEVGTSFGGPQMFNMNIIGLTTELVRSLATHHMSLPARGPAKAMAVPVAGVGAARKRSGMASVVTRMLKEAEAAGVRIYTGHRAISVRRVGECDEYDPNVRVRGKPLSIEFANGAKAITHRLFLNVGKTDLLALGAASEPIKSASADVRRRVEGLQVIGGSKMYCYWPRAWWLADLDFSRGSGHGEQPAVHDTRYHDGPVQCTDPKDYTTCKGGLLVSYEFGDPTGVSSGLYAANHADAPYTPLSATDAKTVMVRASLSPRHSLAWKAIVDGIRTSHGPLYGRKNATGPIPEPDVCVGGSWYDVSMHWPRPVPRLSATLSTQMFAKPVADLNVHLVNEAWGELVGWAEGSLLMAERALGAHMRVAAPKWLDALFYRAVVANFNAGKAAAAGGL